MAHKKVKVLKSWHLGHGKGPDSGKKGKAQKKGSRKKIA